MTSKYLIGSDVLSASLPAEAKVLIDYVVDMIYKGDDEEVDEPEGADDKAIPEQKEGVDTVVDIAFPGSVPPAGESTSFGQIPVQALVDHHYALDNLQIDYPGAPVSQETSEDGPDLETEADEPEVQLEENLPFKLTSPFPNISDEAWTRFAIAMRTEEHPGTVSPSNALGMFAIKTKRLADLGLVRNTKATRDPKTNRMIWVAEFVPPMTSQKFLSNPKLQYDVFVKSMKDYVDKLKNNEIPQPAGGRPAGMTLSGVLAILHRAGPGGIASWNDTNKRFEDTVKLYSKANGIF
jgi:hypothetical protein